MPESRFPGTEDQSSRPRPCLHVWNQRHCRKRDTRVCIFLCQWSFVGPQSSVALQQADSLNSRMVRRAGSRGSDSLFPDTFQRLTQCSLSSDLHIFWIKAMRDECRCFKAFSYQSALSPRASSYNLVVSCTSGATVFKILTSLYASSLQETDHFMTTMQGIHYPFFFSFPEAGWWKLANRQITLKYWPNGPRDFKTDTIQ